MSAVPKPKGKPKNARKKANHERAYGEKADWIRRQPCAICGHPVSEAAHVGGGGTGFKGDSSQLVPLCGRHYEPIGARLELVAGHHRESHRGVKTFEAKYGVDLKAKAAEYESRWLAHTEHPK